MAQYSIIYHVTRPVPAAADPWKPVPLAQAIQWLKCDPDQARRPGRMRYALVKLAAGVVLLSRPPNPISSNLLAPMIQSVQSLAGQNSFLADLNHTDATTLGELEDAAGTLIDEATTEPMLVSLQRKCCPCIDRCVAGPSTDEALTEFEIKVDSSPECMYHVVDPQCWASITPGYFNSVFVLGNAPACTGTPPSPVCPSATPCDTVLGSAQPHTNPPQPAAPWCGLVFEDVTADAGVVTSRFQNVLKASLDYVPQGATPGSATGFRLDYGLCESTYWQMCGPDCKEGTCPLTRDCGHAWVKGTGVTGNGMIDGSKHIQFDSSLPFNANSWAPLALEVMVKETALAACVPAVACPSAPIPTGCFGLPQGDECTCGGHDHCDQKEWVPQIKPAGLCQ